MSIFGIGRLIDANCTIDVEKYSITQGSDGATMKSYAAATSGVRVLFTLMGGNRDGAFSTESELEQATVSGVDASLNRNDVRYKVTAFASRPELVGTYWYVVAAVAHPAGLGGLQPARYTNRVQRRNLPDSGVV
jgi:hypothetical protein